MAGRGRHLQQTWARGDRAALLVVLAGFAVSRLAYFSLGVRFDASTLPLFWQYIDPELLRHDLLRSLWYLHSQPPLFNAYLGVVLKLAGSAADAVFFLVWLAVGIVLTVALFRLLVRLSDRRWLAAAATVVFAASPTAVLFENWLYIEHLVAACLVVAALFLHRFASSGRARDAGVAFGALAVVVLTRPLFHLVWLVALVAIVWLLQPGKRRAVAVAAAVPLLACTAVFVKNAAQFGVYSSTSCSGINAQRVTILQLDRHELAAMIRRGELSRYAGHSPFGLPLEMPEVFRRAPRRGVPLLDRPLKSSHAPNLDHTAYLDICDHYLKDSLTVLRRHPDAFRAGVQQGAFIFWRPPSQYAFFSRRNRKAVKGIERAYGLLAYGQIRPATDYTTLAFGPGQDFHVKRRVGEVAWLALAAYAVVVVAGLALLWRVRRMGSLGSPFALVTAFVLFNVGWVTLVGTMLEAGENNRFRFLVDPLVLALLVGLASRALESRRARTAYKRT